jgi:hypothetical protein
MKLVPRAPAVLRRSLLLAALVLGALLVGAHAAAPASTVHSAARAKAVVGEVLALGGSERLSVRRASGGSPRTLKTGAKLRLGDHVVMGKGVTATLRLTRPKGVGTDTNLIDLSPATGAKHDVAVSRKGRRTTIKITPAG